MNSDQQVKQLMDLGFSAVASALPSFSSGAPPLCLCFSEPKEAAARHALRAPKKRIALESRIPGE